MNDEEEKKCRIIAFGWKNCNCSLCTCHTIRYKSKKLYPFWAVYACLCVCVIDWLRSEDGTIIFFPTWQLCNAKCYKNCIRFSGSRAEKKVSWAWVAKKQPHSNAHRRKKWRRTQVKKSHTSALSHQITNFSTTCNKHHRWWSSFPACTNDNTHAPDAYCQDSSCALLFNCYIFSTFN